LQVLFYIFENMNKTMRRSDCPITLSLDIFGDKWTLLILRDFIFFNNRHFNELVTIEKISTNILTDRLNRLIENGIIKKEVDKNNKSSFLYSLTRKGLDLIPIVIEIYRWGANYTEGNNAENEFKNKVNSVFTEVTQEIIERLKTTHDIK
jgi:DNA-binding HxlR family transcriptional regulator